jgi:Tfp pilus assembly protein PilF
VNEGYIILSKDEPDPVYIFRHNLLKDAAYTVLPLRKRKEIHQRVAQLFETLYAGQLSDFYENVGYHYLSSDQFKKAATYFKLAGDRAKNLYATEQAFSFYETFLKIKKERGNQVPADLVMDVLLHLTDLYEITGNIQKMEKTAVEGLDSARQNKDVESEVNFTERNGYVQILLNNFNKAEELLLLGVQKCEGKLADALTVLYADLGILYAHKYEYEKSILYYNLSWNTARANNIREGEILCLLNLSYLHRNLGNYEQALDYLNYGLENVVSSEDMRSTIQFKQLIADINYQIWNLEKAEAILSESSVVAEAIGSFETYIKSALGLSLINASNGHLEEAEKYLKFVDKKISFFIRESLMAEINLKKAFVYYNKKDYKKTKDYISNALKIARKFKQREIECHCYNFLSLVDEDIPLKLALRALDIAQMTKLPPLIASVLFRLTQLYGEDNDSEKARYYGQKALLIYDDIKTKLKGKNRQFFARKPEYAKLLEM